VEGVSMFLASEAYRCMFVIGVDPQMIAAALDEAHATVRGRLPIYERSVPLGWRFMDKFIQLPFTIPPSSREQLKAFVDGLSEIKIVRRSNDSAHASPDVEKDNQPSKNGRPAADDIDPAQTGTQSDPDDAASESASVRGATKTEKRASGPDKKMPDAAQAVENFKESRDVGVLIRLVAKETSGNPREIKRLANLARLYLGLRNSRRTRQPSWRSPSISQYARWITITLLWPDMLRWLQWGVDDNIWTPEELRLELPERRLRFLQREASHAESAIDWTSAIGAHLGVVDSDPAGWVRDQRLYKFFKAEADMEVQEQLAAAIGSGFW
jgi:hypothetical protein